MMDSILTRAKRRNRMEGLRTSSYHGRPARASGSRLSENQSSSAL